VGTSLAVGDANCPQGGVKYVVGGNAETASYVCNGLEGDAGVAGAKGATGATGTFSGQAILNQTSQQPSSSFDISGNGLIGGSLGVGNGTRLHQSIDSGDGRIRTNGVQFLPQNGTNYGKLTVSHSAAGEAVTVPWTVSDVVANPGMHFDWAAIGPRLGDTTACGGGVNPSYSVDNSNDLSWAGQYSVTFSPCTGNGGACIVGTWEGWELRLFNASAAVVAGSAHSSVNFMLVNEGGVWRVEHMNGVVGVTLFECH
jgi:hypothetical protein